MNINKKLIDRIGRAFHKYDVHPDEVGRVLLDKVGFVERQNRAIDFINGVLTEHGKGHLLAYVTQLAAVESGIKQLDPRQRDHVVHAVRVFVLGIYLNEFFLGSNAVDPFQWKIAGLTHDVGYPLQIASKVGAPFSDEMNKISSDLGIDVPPVQYRAPRIEGLERLTSGIDGLQLIGDQLGRWDVDIDAAEIYAQRTEGAMVCHGVISALAVLKIIDMLYAKENPKREHRDILRGKVNWNQQWFERDVVQACTAIFLHNLENFRFARTLVRADRASVAFLLRLADTLQEWDRPSGKEPDGHSPDLFDIEVSGDKLVYTTGIAEGIKQGLRVTLDQTLADHNVRIE
ncbi:MAG TPA: hypothetical protein VJ783_13560 [Pirellulales bacterium]|nr:hypothetical protein [Pirellulales bacterium]